MRALDETDQSKLPFHLGFTLGHNNDKISAALVDDFGQNWDKSRATVLILLSLSVTFNFIDHCILQDWLQSRKHDACGGSPSVQEGRYQAQSPSHVGCYRIQYTYHRVSLSTLFLFK